MSRVVPVRASRSYEVHIGRGLLAEAGAAIRAAAGGAAACLVTDSTVGPLYAEAVERSLAAAGYRTERFTIPAGEASKTPENALALARFLARMGLTRSDPVVALGGGVVGDLAGFAAATYRRGVGFVQLPTTLLAAVDSSVGGKTAVDLPEGKNLLGAFYQPALVLCDCDTFRTLDPAVLRDGCAEVVKYAVLRDAALFERLRDPAAASSEEVIERCVAHKRDLVELDERDEGPRKLLNLGHTVGHAVELLSGFAVTHGSAVAIGMAVVARAAAKRGFCSAACAEELVALLKTYGLPTETDYAPSALAAAMAGDKKRSGDKIDLILPRAIGRCEIVKTPVSELKAFVRDGL